MNYIRAAVRNMCTIKLCVMVLGSFDDRIWSLSHLFQMTAKLILLQKYFKVAVQ